MIYCRMIAPSWLLDESSTPRVVEGLFSKEEIKERNEQGYNIYYLPNYPKNYESGTVDGSQIDSWNYVFVDYDCKTTIYPSKDAFIETVATSEIAPTKIVDSGNGIHVYWKVSDLDAKSYLRLIRRLTRYFKTDTATNMIFQLMRLPGTTNTKAKDNLVNCVLLYQGTKEYTCEELNKLLPVITPEDEEFCEQHYAKTYNKEIPQIDDALPAKFGKFLRENGEAKSIWSSTSQDRSKDDFRLGHLMFANGFSKEEAQSVLVNTAKAMARAPIHRMSYAQNIVDKIWTYEVEKDETKLSQSVQDILRRSNGVNKNVKFSCHPLVDNTVRGFSLSDVIGLVGGSGIGKTAFGLNMFRWFSERNPDYHHFFVSLEQPVDQIAERWNSISKGDTALNDKVHILSNYDESGAYRNLSLSDIQEYIDKWQKTTNNKVGCVMIDHIGALAKKGAKDEQQDLMAICHTMKAFAVQTNTLLIMQSQTSREKAGIGDLELNKDAAFGTSTFEWYCDYLITLWQPLKRSHMEESCPTVTAYKFCKIRHKKAKRDIIQEDVPYYLYFDTESEVMRGLTQDEKTSFDYFLPRSTNKRKIDRKTGLVEYKSVLETDGTETDSNRQ